MKTLSWPFFLLFLSLSYAQESSDDKVPRHEIKFNVTNLAFVGAVDLSYEYLLGENSSVGLGALHKLHKEEVDPEPPLGTLEISNNRDFSVTPYFRYFFSKRYAGGFFAELFGIFNGGRKADYTVRETEPTEEHPNGQFIKEIKTDKYSNFALGISFGAKIVPTEQMALEFYLGVGANLFDTGTSVTRGGFSLGYRF